VWPRLPGVPSSPERCERIHRNTRSLTSKRRSAESPGNAALTKLLAGHCRPSNSKRFLNGLLGHVAVDYQPLPNLLVHLKPSPALGMLSLLESCHSCLHSFAPVTQIPFWIQQM